MCGRRARNKAYLQITPGIYFSITVDLDKMQIM